MRVQNSSIVTSYVAFGLSFAVIGTASAEPSSIGILVSFKPKEITNPWGGPAKRASVEQTGGQRLSKLLTDVFSYWNFDPRGGRRSTRLEFRVMSGAVDKYIIRVQSFVLGVRSEKWDTDWLDALQIVGRGRLANPDKVPEQLRQAVDARVLGRHGTAIGKWLKTEVPVANGGHWDRPKYLAQAVLALPYQKFGVVGASRFEVLAKPRAGPPERLKVVGLSFMAPYYPSPGANPAFDALVVAVQSRVVGGQERPIDAAQPSEVRQVRQLSLHQIFLEQKLRSDDPQVLIATEDAQ